MAGEWPKRPDAALAGLAPGTVVSGYRIESRIGAGGMAVVFRARDESLGRLIALKVLAPALADDREFRERFIRESRAAAAVEHPHIIPVYSAGEANGVLYLAMRYVSGGDLRSVAASGGPLSRERAVSLLSPVASALDAAHAAGLVHRDVKPANILVDISPGRPDHPYLSDFGLAKGSASAATMGLTGTGQFLGTPDYTAPEQIAGQTVSAKADQYALACATYAMLTGRLAFERDTPMSVLWAHMNAPPPPVTAHRPDLPAAVDEVLARALAKAPGDRFPSCGDFADAVRAALGAGPYALSLASHAPSSPPAAPAAAGARKYPPLAREAAHPVTERAVLPGRATVPPGYGGLHPQTTPDSGVPGDGRGPSGRSPGDRGRRRRWMLVGGGIVAAAGIAAGVLVSVPGSPPPVLQPTGLSAVSETTSTVGIAWNSPASGPQPDSYEILMDGKDIGSVPGSSTTDSIGQLAPATHYDFAVVAIRDGKRSPASASLATGTQAPPLSSALLGWTGTVTWKMTSLEPAAPSWDKQPGDSWTDAFSFTPACSSGPCNARLTGSYVSNPFTMALTRNGATYTGSGPLSEPSLCSSANNLPLTTTMDINITVSAAHTQGGQWTATAFTGTAELVIAAAPSGACHGTIAEYTLSSGTATPGTSS